MSKIILFNQLRKGDFRECMRLMDTEDIDYNIVHSSIKQNYFYFFALGILPHNHSKALEVAERLIDNGVDYHFTDKNGNNLLMLLTKRHAYNLFDFFLNKINWQERNNDSDDIMDVAIKSGNTKAISLLIKNGYTVTQNNIIKALQLQNGSTFKELIKSTYQFCAQDLFFITNAEKHVQFHLNLLDHYKDKGYSFFAQDNAGNTPLHYAIMRGRNQLLESFPKEIHIWFTPNKKGKTCYDLLIEKYTYNTRLVSLLNPLKQTVDEREQLQNIIEKQSLSNKFKI